MHNSSEPSPPPLVVPPPTWPYYSLYNRVKAAIDSLPIHFETQTRIEGMSATDIFSLNAALGATIEEQVVGTLNRIRATWDPDGQYALYGFVRQPQTFPDVILCRWSSEASRSSDIILGIELKGWYLLSKEGEPSFRFTITPQACADADLLVCVPWALKNILSGAPRVFRPYVVPAKHAAQLRNHYWEHERTSSKDRSVISPTGDVHPYPSKADQVADRPAYDGGGNFGRYARTGLMDEYLKTILDEPLCGIAARAWLDFFKVFTQSAGRDDVPDRIAGLRSRLIASAAPDQAEAADAPYLAILDIIEQAI